MQLLNPSPSILPSIIIPTIYHQPHFCCHTGRSMTVMLDPACYILCTTKLYHLHICIASVHAFHFFGRITKLVAYEIVTSASGCMEEFHKSAFGCLPGDHTHLGPASTFGLFVHTREQWRSCSQNSIVC